MFTDTTQSEGHLGICVGAEQNVFQAKRLLKKQLAKLQKVS